MDGNYITLKFGKVSVDILVDTGATVSTINEQTARALKLKVIPLHKNERSTLFSANGSAIKIIGTAEVRLFFSGLIIRQTVRVSSNLQHKFLLGTDFLSTNSAVLNYRLGLMSLHDDLVRVPLHTKTDSLNYISVTRTTCIPAYTEAILPVKSPVKFNNETVLLETLPQVQFDRLAVAKALVTCRNGNTVCRILNFNPHVVTLKRGMKLAKIEQLNTVASIQKYQEPQQPDTQSETPKSETELNEFHKNYGFKINPALTEKQRYELLQLLYDYKDVFARDLSEVKACKAPPLRIDVHTPRKMFQRQFRLSEADREEASRQILEMERNDIIEYSDTPYFNSAIFLVRKKDNTRRLVVDLRGINSLIIPKLVQLPHIDELIERIAVQRPKWLSVIDIRAAFWQLTIHEQSRDLTSFTSPEGLRYRFKRCPFGLSTSPSQLILTLSTLFADKNRFHSIGIYMDDLILFSRTFSSHLEQLKVTLETLKSNSLSCNPKKTELCFDQVEYLGFRVSSEGIRINERRIEAIKHITAPKNVKGLLRILGNFNFWRKYIPNYAKRTYNMRKLLRKQTKFVWTEQCENELNYLKTCLTKDPILRPLDPRRDLIIATDGSKYGYGWSIMQRDEQGQLYVVQYGARSTTPAQQNYTADDLECIALVYALKSIEPVAIHKQVTVLTDNSHVLHLRTWKPINARQRRMLCYLMQFSLSIKFIKGVRNLQADCLSRVFQESPPEQRREHEYKVTPADDDFILPVTTRSMMTRPSLDSMAEGTAPALQPVSAPAITTDAESEIGLLSEPATSEICVDSPTDLCNDTSVTETQIPVISGEDYKTDNEFQAMYNYLRYGDLSGNDRTDKTTLLIADQYILEDDRLYRLEAARKKRLARLRPLSKRLCVPLKFRHEIIRFAHDSCGHYSTHSLFLTLSPKYFWKSLFLDIEAYVRTCENCMRSKRNFSHKYAPLHPVPIVARWPGDKWSLDFKPLTRKTAAGNTAILVIVDSLTSWPILIPVPDQSAETTAQMFVKYVIATFSLPSEIMTDKGPAFISTFFAKINELLGIRHRMSASLNPRSNGLAEATVKRLIEFLKLYATDDLSIEAKLPLIELSMRVTSHSRLELSPFEVCFGRQPNLHAPGEPDPSLPFSGDKLAYYNWLSKEMKRLHAAVRERKQDIKQDDKQQYDRRNRVKTPQWAVGDRVLLLDTRVKPNADKVITNKRYHGPYVVQDIVQNEDIGSAYQLIRESDAKPLKNLVYSDRLKAFNTDRTELNKRLPRLTEDNSQQVVTDLVSNMDKTQGSTTVGEQQTKISQGWESAKQIVGERMIRGKRHYLVRFHDDSVHLCDAVSKPLLDHYRQQKQ